MEEFKKKLERLKLEAQQKKLRIEEQDVYNNQKESTSSSHKESINNTCQKDSTSNTHKEGTSHTMKESTSDTQKETRNNTYKDSTNNSQKENKKGRKRVSINHKEYTILNRIGKGGSTFCESYGFCVAIKCVNLTNESNVREAYENEIKLLEKLQGSPYIIKIEKKGDHLFVVLERGDIDLASFMEKRAEQMDDKFIKYHWQDMLRCVKVIHDRNLKPANFLFVGASLKLIDFGIATNIPSNLTSAVKDIQIGTISYMSPEAISGSDAEGNTIPLKSDVWSLGCILYAMVYKKSPFHSCKNQIAKLNAIVNETYKIEFPPIRDPLLLNVLKRCLVRNVKKRASVDELLDDPYLKE